MEGHAKMEVLRTLKGPPTGEVSVHLVARDSPGSSSHLPTTAFIIPGGPSQGSGEEEHPYTCPSRCGSWGGDDTFLLPTHMHGRIAAELTCVVSVRISVRSQFGHPWPAQQCPGCVLLSAGADSCERPGASDQQRTCHGHRSAAVKRRAGDQLQCQHSAAAGVDRGRGPASWEWPAGQCLWGLAEPSEPQLRGGVCGPGGGA